MGLNEQGAGIFVMVNAGDGKGRKRANVRAVRALFVDLDGAPLEPVVNGPIAPHMVTETSLGRWHAFWLVIPVGQRNTTLFKATAGFKHAGIPKAAAAERIAKINTAHMSEPLPAEELKELIDRAYSYETDGFSMIPHRVIDMPAFNALSAAAAKVFLYAMRRHRPEKQFALPHSEFTGVVGLKNRQQCSKARDELIDAGFLVRTRQHVASLDPDGRRCALYRIGDQVLPRSASGAQG